MTNTHHQIRGQCGLDRGERLRRRLRHAFTFVEVMVVIVIVGILAAIVVPKFSNARGDAELSALKSTLAAVRSSISVFHTQSILDGAPAYPTFKQLTAGTDVLPDGIPANPLTGSRDVIDADFGDAVSRKLTDDSAGWVYGVDNASTPPRAVFYSAVVRSMYDPAVKANVNTNEL